MSELVEYTRENYPSFGKKYKGEKAVISLTSWTARINTVSKTLYSLVKMCPGFHIMLVLAEEEFPKMTKELPENLMLFVDNELIELMFVRKNYKSFKKVLFSMDKYRDVPVISADDDCIYICNYAQILYDKWLRNKNYVITNNGNSNKNFIWTQGTNTLFPPYCFDTRIIKFLSNAIIKINNDDAYLGVMYKKYNKKIIQLKQKNFFIFHDEIKPLSAIRAKRPNKFLGDLELYNRILTNLK